MIVPRIVTFYSYKGGTGRSMALANAAWILASNGSRVLTIDWDLEAPGLHRYFHPFLEDKELTETDGLMDFVMRYAEQAITPQEGAEWYRPYADILKYAESLNYEFSGGGSLDFVCAGRQGAGYAARVNSFDWRHLYEKLNGGLFFEALKRSMGGYHYVLIDSRTGVSDTSGICTVQMPHVLVVCFTLNRQSIEGALAIAKSADAQRRGPDGKQTLKIFPVPTRVELSEHTKLMLARKESRERFSSLLNHLKEPADTYWSKVEVPHQSYYAYEEVLATFGDQPGLTNSMLSRMESLCGYITGSPSPVKMPPPKDRKHVLSLYAREQQPPGPPPIRKRLEETTEAQKIPPTAPPRSPSDSVWLYVSYSRADASMYLDRFVRDLVQELELRLPNGAKIVSFDTARYTASRLPENWDMAVKFALRNCRTAICLISPAYVNSAYCGKEFSVLRARSQGQQSILPVTWVALSEKERLPQDIHVLAPEGGGLASLMRLTRYNNQYRAFLTDLVSRLCHAGNKWPLQPLTIPPVFEQTPNAFETLDSERGTGRRVLVGFIAARRDDPLPSRSRGAYGYSTKDWSPYGESALLTAQLSTVRHKFYFEEVQVPVQNLGEIARKAQTNNQLFLLIVDGPSLVLDRYTGLPDQFRTIGAFNCAVVVVDPVPPPILPFLKHAPLLYLVKSQKDLEAAIDSAISRMRIAVLEFSEPQRDFDPGDGGPTPSLPPSA